MSVKGNLLIVEDNTEILDSLTLFLEDEFSVVVGIKNPELIPSTLQNSAFDLVLLDMNFTVGLNTGSEGLHWLKEILKLDPSLSVIMMTAYGDVELAVKAMRNGASDFVLKPWDNEKLLATLLAGLKLRRSNMEIQKLRGRQNHLVEELNQKFPEIIGECPSMKRVMDIVEKVSNTDANILLTGENGTGKGLIAREIHKRSVRSKEAMITVDMGSIPLSLFESEMFGHVKGAFTDARHDRVGRFETASGGSLFLDEIGNLSLNMQTKILNVLQEKYIIPLGTNKIIPIDIRLICATNKNLEKMVMEGLFRQDLLFRINTIQIDLPPLRERGNDINLMAGYFLNKFATKYERGKMHLSSETINSMQEYLWPGNIRELEHSIEKAVILAEGDIITPDDLFLKRTAARIQQKKEVNPSFNDIERDIIRRALLRNNGNMVTTARELGVTRQTIYNKIKRYGL
ncbi:MAG: sigma-54 dependent transcriptional regulator [Bacteroidetes bacterium]|nr:sigma-54 dependent transcriptional regulator [Bacteroidota bacterium]